MSKDFYERAIAAESPGGSTKCRFWLSAASSTLIWALVLTPFLVLRIVSYLVEDVGAEPDPFPEPGRCFLIVSVLAFSLSACCAFPVVLACRLVVRRPALLLLLAAFASMPCLAAQKNRPETAVVKVLSQQLPHEAEKKQEFLMALYFDHEKELEFGSYSTKNWKKNYATFAEVLVAKAERQKLDSVSLRKVLDLVLKDSAGAIAYLPVAAYQTTLDGKLVWIIMVKWEYPAMGQAATLVHIRTFAFDQKTLGRVGYTTCG